MHLTMERISSNKTGKCGLSLPIPGITSITRLISGQNHERNRQSRARIHLWLPIIILSIGRVHALDIEYCSSINTGSSYGVVYQQFQSNGLCYDNCKASYAFAIVQGFRCWCSDYIPATTTTGCDEICPGYGIESCGNTKKGLFGYIPLPNQPKGTSGGSTTASTTTTTTEPTTSSTPTTLTTSTTTDSSSSTPSVTIVTSIGGYRTVTLTPSNGPTSSTTPSAGAASSRGNFFSKPGKVAGLFVGLALGVIALVAGLLLFCYRRNRQKGGADPSMSGTIPAGGAGVIPGRRRSRSLSTLGLIGEKASAAGNAGPPSAKPNTPGLSAAEVRKSAPIAQPPGRLIDQRLDPNQIYLRYDPDTGSSRMSVRSLRDDTDYSRRVLRLANPDD